VEGLLAEHAKARSFPLVWLREPLPGETYETMPSLLCGGVPFDWGPQLRSDLVYTLSCWTFACVGVGQCLFAKPSEKLLSWWWWRTEGAALIVMSCVSCVADVSGVDRVGLAHVMDRVLASILSATFCLKVCLVGLSAYWLGFALGLCAPCLAGGCFVMKRRAVQRRHIEDYIMWTTLWHLVFPACGLLWYICALVSVFVLGR